MKVCNQIANLFCSNSQITSTKEDFDFFEQIYILDSIDVPIEQELHNCFTELSERETITIYVNIDEADEDLTYTQNHEYNIFKSDLEVNMRGIEAKTLISIKIKIRKQIVENYISICSLSVFSDYLNSFTTSDLLNFFSEKIKAYENIIFISTEIAQIYQSGSIAFSNSSKTEINFSLNSQNRSIQLKKIQASTHATQLSDKTLLPEDFDFVAGLESQLLPIIQRIHFTLIVFSIFDITHLDGNNLTFRLNGYKGIDGELDTSLPRINLIIDEYKYINNWIYQSGNLNDKLGIARNIISLHLNSANDLSFNGNMFNSILSAYKVYEKQNIKQYIEIRNKLSDQLIDYNKRASSIVESFASTFQKSALSVVTLFSSLIAVKVLGASNPSKNLITYSVIFVVIFLFISLIYMLMSRSEASEQKARYERSYKNFKDRYTDLLNSEDINKILNDDREFNADVEYIQKKIKNYTILWSISLIAIFIFVLIYYLSELCF